MKAQGVQSTAADLKGLDTNVRKAGAGIATTEKQGSRHLDKLGKQTTLFGRVTSSGFSRFAVGATGATAALGGVGLAMKSVIGAASDVNESLTKNQVLFRRHAKEVDAFSKRSAESFGISRAAALEYTGVFGNLFNALGVSTRKSAEFSVSLTKLAADMASFNNTSIDDALEAIRSGLVGETEPLRRFGVNLQDATLRQQALAMGLTKSTSSVLTPYQKALAAQALIVKQTAAAHGDFQRTQGGLANQTRILQARISDLKVSLGTLLLPVITTVLTELNKLTSGIHSAGDAQVRLQQALGLTSAEFAQFRQAVSNVTTALAPVFNAVVSGWRTTLGGFVQWLRGWVQLFSGIFTGDFRKAWDGLKNIVGGALQGVIGAIRLQTVGIRAIAGVMGRALTSGFKGALNLAHELAVSMRDLIAKAPGYALGVGKAIIRGIIDGIKSAAGGIGDAIGKAAKGAIPKLPDLNPFGEGLGASSIVPLKGGGNLMGARASMGPFAAVGASNGLRVSSGLRRGAITSSGNTSYHSTGEAVDLAGSPAGMMKTFKTLRSKFGSRLAELIYTPGGAGIKNGKPNVYTGQVAADHFDHVHVAYDTGMPGVGDGVGKRAGRFMGDGPGMGGPTDKQRATLQEIANRVWGAVGGYIGGGLPPLSFFGGGPNSAAVGSPGGGVRLPAWGWRGLLSKDPYALGTLTHELAHTHQRQDVSAGLREGSAEAFAKLTYGAASSATGTSGAFRGYKGYAALMKQALAKGKDWVLHGQFGFPGTGKVGQRPYSTSGIQSLWTSAGGSAATANMAAAIALAESGGQSTASHRNTDGSIDRGLWQINSVHGKQSTFNPAANARAAVSISSGGRNWNPWVTFKTGAYKKFLKGGAAKVTGKAGRSGNKLVGVGKPSFGSKGGLGFSDQQIAEINAQADYNAARQAESGTSSGGESGGSEVDTGQALIDAIKTQTSAIASLKAAIDVQNAIAGSTLGIGLKEAQRALADMIANQLGSYGGTAGRALTAGSGTVVRY